MDFNFHLIFLLIQRCISFLGILVILSGVLTAICQYFIFMIKEKSHMDINLDTIRLKLGQKLLLGLECIVAADLIGTMTTPDYYSVGIVACIVVIRTILSYTLNREIMSLKQ